MAAVAADVVRTLQFATVRAFVECFDLERIVRATHAATGRRYFSLGDSHGGTNSSNNTCVRATGAMILEGRPYGKDGLRTSLRKCGHSLASSGGKAGAIAENSRVASSLAAP
jgi:hypothetical protein